MPQTIKQRRAIRWAANDPRVERATYHRDPYWLEPPPRSLGDTAVAWALRAAALGIVVVLLLGGRYEPDTQVVAAEVRR